MSQSHSRSGDWSRGRQVAGAGASGCTAGKAGLTRESSRRAWPWPAAGLGLAHGEPGRRASRLSRRPGPGGAGAAASPRPLTALEAMSRSKLGDDFARARELSVEPLELVGHYDEPGGEMVETEPAHLLGRLSHLRVTPASA